MIAGPKPFTRLSFYPTGGRRSGIDQTSEMGREGEPGAASGSRYFLQLLFPPDTQARGPRGLHELSEKGGRQGGRSVYVVMFGGATKARCRHCFQTFRLANERDGCLGHAFPIARILADNPRPFICADQYARF